MNGILSAMLDDVEHLWGSHRLILGPMVRASSLPLRLAALDYGADVVYSEEIPAYRADPASCKRVVNDVTGTIDFIEPKKDSKDTLVLFRTHLQREVASKRCVLQLGTTDAVTALRAAQLFERDVAAIDINMGCAKHYSVSRGMGAAHMNKPALAEDIVKTLRRNLSIPVSVKTRLQAANCTGSCHSNNTASDGVDVNASVEWLRWLQSAGAQAVALHMRTPLEKTRDAAHWDRFALCHQAMRASNTPLVYNGDMWSRSEAQRLHESVYPVNSASAPYTVCYVPIMICRPALWNPSVFTQFKPHQRDCTTVTTTTATPTDTEHEQTLCTLPAPHATPINEVLACILKHCASTAHCPLNTRYLLQQTLAGAKMLSSDTRAEVVKSRNLMMLSNVLDCREFVRKEKVRQKVLWDVKLSQRSLTLGVGGVSNADSVSRECISQYCNSYTWPGIVCKTSHEYNDRYFDDNYYVAFSKPNHAYTATPTAGTSITSGVDTTCAEPNAHASESKTAVKRPFAFAGFSESNSTVVRIKKSSL